MHAPHPNLAPDGPGDESSHSAHVTVHLADTREVEFLLERTQGRLTTSVGVSVLTHALFILTALFIVTSMPALTIPLDERADREVYNIVWVPQEGPGGGGGGGGNRSPEPPRQTEMPGRDRMSLPVSKPVTIEQPKPPKPSEIETPPVELTIPALAMASGVDQVVGALQGIPDPTSTSQGSGSGGGAGTGRGTGIGPGTGSGLGPGSGGGTGGGVYRPGSGVSTPRVLREVKPQYTPDALRAKIQGEVWLDCVVLATGDVGSCDVVRSLDSVFGLDQEAIKAAKQWRFVPGTRQGMPVSVLVTISMGFTLR
jgi:TonB family protein